MLAIRRGLAVAPKRMRHKMFHDLRAPYGLTGINAGDTEAVHERTIANVHRQQLVEVQGQTDVLVMGVPYLGPYNVNSTMNPILATCMGLGYYFNSYRDQPVVRRGGAVILYHPLEPDFNQLHHPSYVDFYEEILAESTDPAVIEAKYEEQFATDPWYIHLYRTSHAYHGVHPFYMWYWAAHAMDHVDDVIWVGGNRKVGSAAGVPGRVDAGRRARDGVRDGRQQPVDHLPAQPAAPDRGRAMMAGFLREDGVDDVRTVAKGWRWGRRPLVPRSAEQFVLPSQTTVFPTDWSRRRPARYAREAVQKGALEPLMRSQVRRHVEGLDVLSRIDGPVIFVANHASHLDTPLILLSLPDEWRRRTAVAAAADYFFDTWWRAVGLGDRVQHLPDRPPRRLDGDHAGRGAGRRLEPGDLPRGHPLQGRLGRPLPARRGVPRLPARRARSCRSPTAAPSPRCRAARAGPAAAGASSRSGSASR